eukprot:523954_1
MSSLLDLSKQINENKDVQAAISAQQNLEQVRHQKTMNKLIQSNLFRCDCEYKNNDNILQFKHHYIVIDIQYKEIKLYENEKQLKTKQNPIIKLQLTQHYKLVKSENIQNKQNCIILKTKQAQHIFYFDDINNRENALNYFNKLLPHTKPTIESSKSVPALLKYDSNENNEINDMKLLSEFHKLETFAKNDNAKGLSNYINNNKNIINEKHINKINLILNAKDYKFLQTFNNSQGLTYLCILTIINTT